MKQFFKKNKHHFGLWALSGLILLGSTFWLNSLEKKEKEQQVISPKVLVSTTSSLVSVVGDQEKTLNKVSGTSPLTTSSATSSAVLSSVEPEKKENLVTFQFISPGEEKKMQITIVEDETVYQVMLRLKQEQGLVFEVKDYSGVGVFVESISNLANNSRKNKFWMYYLNGKTANTGISLTKLHYNDLITWRYEEGKF
ncbi:MAG: DUF4430 domain-containing protein [Candidatus Magasanikbacteria bacterium]|nr:DUF4430 domain-containing protein [Candidatus Magasanikbacteria bacterium]